MNINNINIKNNNNNTTQSIMSLPITYDPITKIISINESAQNDQELKEEIDQLNRLSKDFINLNSEIPESPEPSKTLTPLIKKLVTSGIDAQKRGKHHDAIKQFSLAIDMASRRSRWEAFAIQLQELNLILMARCDSYIMTKNWIDAYNDADMLLGTQVNTPENFLRRATAASNMGRLTQAKYDLERGLCFVEDDERIKTQLGVVNRLIAVENGDL
ncbi:Translocation protein [Wickerhamomyces ciferrii]|uniref:Translocation protein n=1 Tax=Wickerhamomyces ciferrii (strain ATCC 14091 / BCRC 22168 / CBS 111 / JCM 3599 / NBRC 0793 / NRRL Y-1031 F-60-10) TaxID=1206466 RepID=K0KU12_WICCF|nr:Translocation protein [Wickerhamomyces ciferrii]CCH44894.1 Translocation protein [Wickerhamomyces ciferrii]